MSSTPIPTPGAPPPPASIYRILIVDDNPAIHEDFRKIFIESTPPAGALRDLESSIFGDTSRFTRQQSFELESALQGQEGLEKVSAAVSRKLPFSLAFVDVRMPPGWDGLETVEQLWKVDPDLQVVICTAYSDYSWMDMRRRLGNSDSLLVLKKPFDNIEVLQLAHALSRKNELSRQLRANTEDLTQRLAQRTRELEESQLALQAERALRQQAEQSGRQTSIQLGSGRNDRVVAG